MITRFSFIGLLQGVWLWAWWRLVNDTTPWFPLSLPTKEALLYLGLAAPLSVYLTASHPTLSAKKRRYIIAGVAVLFALLGWWDGWMWIQPESPDRRLLLVHMLFPNLLPAGVLGFMLIPLLMHFDMHSKRWSYHALFETAWRNIIACLSAAILTGLFWGVLHSSAALFKLIGVDFLEIQLQKPFFVSALSGVAFGGGIAFSFVRAELIVSLRRFACLLQSWLLPLMLMFIAIWVASLLFTGVGPLFATKSAAFILLWCMALCIAYANAVYQDGQTPPPFGTKLNRIIAWLWLCLPVLLFLAWQAMGMRIAQHGWTEDRVWGVFVLLNVSLYVLGYSWSAWRKSAWLGSIGTTNIVTAVFMSLGLLALLSPLASPSRIAANSQIERLLAQKITPETFDYDHLRWHAGKYGLQALQNLANGVDHPMRALIASNAKISLSQKSAYQNQPQNVQGDVPLRELIRPIPDSAVLEDALLKAISDNRRDDNCRWSTSNCVVWFVDLDDNGSKEAILFSRQPGYFISTVFERQGEQYRRIGVLRNMLTVNDWGRLISDLEQNNFKLVPYKWRDIELAGKRSSVIPE